MTALDCLADQARWTAWRNELGPTGKPTKIPHTPWRERAKIDDPASWVTLREAEACARQIIDGLGGGVMVALGDLGDDQYLSGLDLDGCINEEGTLADWAAAILVAAPTYAEISPSGRGLKVFFFVESTEVRPLLDAIGAAHRQWGVRRGVPGFDDRNHGPAIEIYMAARFFTVTGRHWPTAPDEIRLLDFDQLQRLRALIPQNQKFNLGPGGRAASAAAASGYQADPAVDAMSAHGDNSRSGKAFREGLAYRQQHPECTFDEMVAHLRANPELAEWVKEKGEPHNRRELLRIWEKYDQMSGNDDVATIARLRAIYLRSPLAYDRIRQAEAEKLGVRVTTLDRKVQQGIGDGNGGDKPGQGRPLEFPEIEPWPDWVDGDNLLKAIAAAYLDHVILPTGAADALALWVIHTHARAVSTIFPRVIFGSVEMRSGKTTALNITGAMSARALSSANTTAAAIYRTIEACSPTLLIDEADTFVAEDNELRGIFNAGFQLGGEVIRTVGDDHEPRRFRCDGPVAFAGIGKLPGTMEDRSIKIVMRRRRPDETFKRFRPDRMERFSELARRAVRWVEDNLDQLRMIDDPDVPAALDDRAADCWRPLLAIAELVGGEWPKRARDAALALTQSTEDTASTRVLLLADLRDLFNAEKSGVLFTTEILNALHKRDDRPWPEFGKKQAPITGRQVASLLKPFGITAPKDPLWRGAEHARGYRHQDLEDAFLRYLS